MDFHAHLSKITETVLTILFILSLSKIFKMQYNIWVVRRHAFCWLDIRFVVVVSFDSACDNGDCQLIDTVSIS